MPIDYYIVSQIIDVLSLTEKWLGTEVDQLTMNQMIATSFYNSHN